MKGSRIAAFALRRCKGSRIQVKSKGTQKDFGPVAISEADTLSKDVAYVAYIVGTLAPLTTSS
jgi:hypothetical protein